MLAGRPCPDHQHVVCVGHGDPSFSITIVITAPLLEQSRQPRLCYRAALPRGSAPGFLTWVRAGFGGRCTARSRGEAAVIEDREATMMTQATYSPGPQTDGVTGTEAHLVAQLRAGDEAAMAQLVDQWSPAMLRVARSFVDSPQSAEDVVQNTWLGML